MNDSAGGENNHSVPRPGEFGISRDIAPCTFAGVYSSQVEEAMESIRIRTVVAKDGEITVTNLPIKHGETVEIIVLPPKSKGKKRKTLTVGDLVASGLIGLWQDRTDLPESEEYARQLRNQAQKRDLP